MKDTLFNIVNDNIGFAGPGTESEGEAGYASAQASGSDSSQHQGVGSSVPSLPPPPPHPTTDVDSSVLRPHSSFKLPGEVQKSHWKGTAFSSAPTLGESSTQSECYR